MSRAGRLFEIVQLLQGVRQAVPAREIATALEVSVRTIYRDVGALQAMRVPVEGEAGVGYVLRPDFALPPLAFTPEEVEAVTVGLALLGRTGDRGLHRAALSVRRKLAESLPGRQEEIGNPRLSASDWNALPPATVDYGLLRGAIRDERKLHLVYRDRLDCSTVRVLLPLALVYYIDSVVLAGWCELRGDFRHFRLDRITACRVSDASFEESGSRLRARWAAQKAEATASTA
jgi:predicted DNA-binding transcriptional regulator YafY